MTLIVGHRGGRNLWPENSLTGFRNLCAHNVDAVEFDVHLSDAGELLVIHDPMLDRTTDATGLVRSVTPEQRRTIQLKDSADTIPLLEDVLEVFANTSLGLHIELKADQNGMPYTGMAAQIIAQVKAHGLAGRSILTSFQMEALDEVKSLAPDIARLCSVNAKSAERLGLTETLKQAAERAEIIAIQMDLFAREWDAILAVLPLERLGAWVPNTATDIAAWLGRAPRSITSDDPVLAVSIRDGLNTAT